MKISEFLDSLREGREIECHFANELYFIQPDYDNNALKESPFKIVLYHCPQYKETIELFCGTPEELLKFCFDGKNMLGDSWDLFAIDYIL